MAVIPVTPATDLSALIASDNVSPGDVLVLEDGEYFQTVVVSKDYLWIVAKGKKALFNGRGLLLTGFILNGVTGVEVEGMIMMNYRSTGISITGGGGHRIVGNKINGMQGNGIGVASSRDNLLWRNEICNVFRGVQLFSTSVNNRIIANLATLCADDGFECFLQNDRDNVFAGNVSVNNGAYGLYSAGNNNLLLDNILIGNRIGGLNINTTGNAVAIGNIIKGNGEVGSFLADLSNLFFGENKVEGSLLQGLAVVGTGDYGIFQQNRISHNTNTGIFLGALTRANFVHNNKLRCNLPSNIRDNGNNIFLDNLDEPCKSNELQFEDCHACLEGFAEISKEKRKKGGVLTELWEQVAEIDTGEYSAISK